MGEIWIDGAVPLSGEVRIQGSKNAALPMMAAALLHEGKAGFPIPSALVLLPG